MCACARAHTLLFLSVTGSHEEQIRVSGPHVVLRTSLTHPAAAATVVTAAAAAADRRAKLTASKSGLWPKLITFVIAAASRCPAHPTFEPVMTLKIDDPVS